MSWSPIQKPMKNRELMRVIPWRMMNGTGMNAPNHMRILKRGKRT